MELEFELANGFEERGKPECPKKNLSEQLERTDNKLNPHMGWTARPDLNPSDISRGRRVLSPLQLKKGTSSIQLSQLNLESHTEGPTNCTDSDKY